MTYIDLNAGLAINRALDPKSTLDAVHLNG